MKSRKSRMIAFWFAFALTFGAFSTVAASDEFGWRGAALFSISVIVGVGVFAGFVWIAAGWIEDGAD